MDRQTRTVSDLSSAWRLAVRRPERGFALLLVLWTLVLISFLIGRLSAAGSTELRIAGNLEANAAARAAADGALYQAIFTVSRAVSPTGSSVAEVPQEIRIGNSLVTLRIENEAARVNPNFASPDLVEALLRVLGSDPEQAQSLAAAIAEWVGRPHPPAIKAGLQTPSPGYLPPRAPLESIEELARVHGMTPELLAALRPHLTLFGPGEPDPSAVDPEIAAALALTGRGPAADASPRLATEPDTLTLRIHALAQGPGNALVSRTAVVRFDPQSPNRFGLLARYSSDESYE